MHTEKIVSILEKKFSEPEFLDCFLVDIEQKGKKIAVFVDSDTILDFTKCQNISRTLEKEFDENAWFGEDYILEVSSPGIGRSLKFPRQYIKNIGRDLVVTLLDGQSLDGLLESADPDTFVLTKEVISRDPNNKKKKIKEIVKHTLNYSQIKEAIVQLKF